MADRNLAVRDPVATDGFFRRLADWSAAEADGSAQSASPGRQLRGPRSTRDAGTAALSSSVGTGSKVLGEGISLADGVTPRSAFFPQDESPVLPPEDGHGWFSEAEVRVPWVIASTAAMRYRRHPRGPCCSSWGSRAPSPDGDDWLPGARRVDRDDHHGGELADRPHGPLRGRLLLRAPHLGLYAEHEPTCECGGPLSNGSGEGYPSSRCWSRRKPSRSLSRSSADGSSPPSSGGNGRLLWFASYCSSRFLM